MSRLIFDIETDGLIPEMTTIHSLVIKDADRGEVFSCASDPTYYREDSHVTSALTIKQGLEHLMEADEIIGHNILKFDIPAIQKVYPWFEPAGRIFDTLICSRLIWSDLREDDFRFRNKPKGRDFPGKLIGSHGLEAWGIRLGEWKGDYAKEREAELKAQFAANYEAWMVREQHVYEMMCAKQDERVTKVGFERHLKTVDVPPEKPTKDEITAYVWGSWNHSMQTYCEQDVEVTHAFLKLIESKNYSERAIRLEHDFAAVIKPMEDEGFSFDKQAAKDLTRILMRRKAEIEAELQVHFPPWEVKTPFIPKVNNAKLGYEAGKKTYKVRTVVFNPGSRDHIADRLITLYGWEPTEFTATGKPEVNETTLKGLNYPPAKLLNEYLMIAKRLGQVAEGNQAWLNLVQDRGKGTRIYGEVMTNGAVTGRCTHKRPNVAQTPAVKKNKDGTIKLLNDGGYGAECRACFTAPKGMKLVGADLSGLELRCLAHFMARFDGGAYIKELLEGDIHTANQLAAGLPSRDNAKTFIYGFLYGAGAAKIGSIVGKGSKEGQRLIKQFLDQTPALKKLRLAVAKKTARFVRQGRKRIPNPHYVGYLVGLDGRRLPIRHEHAALNTLLQSAGALISKEATVLLYRDLTTRGLVFGKDWALVAHVHDEVQMWAKPELAEEVGKAAVSAFEQAGINFDFRCPITGEFKIGDNWRDTH